jgi:hypothetical protein
MGLWWNLCAARWCMGFSRNLRAAHWCMRFWRDLRVAHWCMGFWRNLHAAYWCMGFWRNLHLAYWCVGFWRNLRAAHWCMGLWRNLHAAHWCMDFWRRLASASGATNGRRQTTRIAGGWRWRRARHGVLSGAGAGVGGGFPQSGRGRPENPRARHGLPRGRDDTGAPQPETRAWPPAGAAEAAASGVWRRTVSRSSPQDGGRGMGNKGAAHRWPLVPGWRGPQPPIRRAWAPRGPSAPSDIVVAATFGVSARPQGEQQNVVDTSGQRTFDGTAERAQRPGRRRGQDLIHGAAG